MSVEPAIETAGPVSRVGSDAWLAAPRCAGEYEAAHEVEESRTFKAQVMVEQDGTIMARIPECQDRPDMWHFIEWLTMQGWNRWRFLSAEKSAANK
jgi:hypothetical protein